MSGKTIGVVVGTVALLATVLVGWLVLSGGDDTSVQGGATPSPTASPLQSAPGGGDITETEEPGDPGQTVKADITRPVRLGNGVEVKVLSTKPARVKPEGPGEGGGPAVVVRLRISNNSADPIDISGAIVTLVYGDNQVAQPSTSPPSSPFRGDVAKGDTQDGTYVFRVPPKPHGSLSVVVQYGAGSGIARFVP